MQMPLYARNFYKNRQESSRRSAREIIPLILEFIQPESIIDVGCGTGTWLSVFKEYGFEDIAGVDGEWVEKEILQIPEDLFITFDLQKPFRMDRQFDLVVSLEVAEHLPPGCAKTFVDSLVELGPVILFSAAIPFQGGTHHLNEQWPEYWVKYFEDKGYVVIDCMRKKIWQNDSVALFYAQNLLIFAKRDYLRSHPLLWREFESTNARQLSIVHPGQYLQLQAKYLRLQALVSSTSDPRNLSLKKVLSALPTITKRALEIRAKKILNALRKMAY